MLIFNAHHIVIFKVQDQAPQTQTHLSNKKNQQIIIFWYYKTYIYTNKNKYNASIKVQIKLLKTHLNFYRKLASQ